MPFPEEWNMKRLGKDAVLRPLSNEEETLASVPKLVKENKRKRASVPEDPKPKKRMALLRLRDEDAEEKENDGSALAVRTKRTTDAPSAAKSMMLHEAPPRTEDISEKDSGGIPKLSEIEDASHRSPRMGDMSEGAPLEPLRTEENAPSDSFGAAAIEDSPTFPVFSAGAVAVHREACSRSQNELRRYEADLQRVTEERNSLKLLLGQREKEIKDLRAELAKAYRDQTDLSEQWKKGMDRFAAEKETVRAQLPSAKTQLQRMKEKGLAQVRRIEELEARLASVLAKAESDAEKAKADVDALVAVYRAYAEDAQTKIVEFSTHKSNFLNYLDEILASAVSQISIQYVSVYGSWRKGS
ncbi:uncharacterized protein [Nicotiana tomentosiformis]|uniref:uncharacterized protein n=1 Tax=Nicotiana tomentosiformis TaxID=4098 RepID=UPI00388C391F